jgi:hypothetical protein
MIDGLGDFNDILYGAPCHLRNQDHKIIWCLYVVTNEAPSLQAIPQIQYLRSMIVTLGSFFLAGDR